MHRHAATPSLSACCWLPSSRAFCRPTDLSGPLLTQGKVRKLSGMRNLYWHSRTCCIQTPRYCPVGGIDRWSFWACQTQPFLLDIIICFVFISPKPRESHDYNCPSDLLWIAQPVGISCLSLSSFPSTYESRQYLGTSTSGSSIAGPLVYFIPADKSNSITAPLPSPRLPLPPKATPWHFFRHYSEDACPNSLGQPGSIKHPVERGWFPSHHRINPLGDPPPITEVGERERDQNRRDLRRCELWGTLVDVGNKLWKRHEKAGRTRGKKNQI